MQTPQAALDGRANLRQIASKLGFGMLAQIFLAVLEGKPFHEKQFKYKNLMRAEFRAAPNWAG
ncbi:hypothetical protein H8A97_24605 [Bradyrhizobium sp. Arg62]|uniref:hypothetical protein n=1 Tax=Bradyrhizobium brasilense TaxID=1419277 RepID=UPI001E5D3DFB|nr:hypothetical protein [Bradyrhizobium brasilense]MCC8948203.1 hypothetical protein [Bradyrhizobium brasilense]